MKRNSFFSFFVLVFFALLLSCGGGSGDPGSPGSGGSGETGCMPIVESVAPSNTYLRASDLTTAESVEVTIGEYDLPNQEGTCTGMTFTKYTVQYMPLEPGCPFLDNRYYTGTWYVEPNTNATFNLTFWDFYTKLQYRYPNDPRIYRYTVLFTMEGFNVFGKKQTLTFQFEVTTKK